MLSLVQVCTIESSQLAYGIMVKITRILLLVGYNLLPPPKKNYTIFTKTVTLYLQKQSIRPKVEFLPLILTINVKLLSLVKKISCKPSLLQKALFTAEYS